MLACFEQALRLGQEQGALASELRAAMSLVRLRERQGEAYAAELILSIIFDRKHSSRIEGIKPQVPGE